MSTKETLRTARRLAAEVNIDYRTVTRWLRGQGESAAATDYALKAAATKLGISLPAHLAKGSERQPERGAA